MMTDKRGDRFLEGGKSPKGDHFEGGEDMKWKCFEVNPFMVHMVKVPMIVVCVLWVQPLIYAIYVRALAKYNKTHNQVNDYYVDQEIIAGYPLQSQQRVL